MMPSRIVPRLGTIAFERYGKCTFLGNGIHNPECVAR
jgi:hypothetical protein